MKNIHYSWIICLSCTLILICTMGFSMNVFPVYLPYLEEELLTGTQSSALITVRCVSSIAAMAGVERFYRRVSLRGGLTLACGVTAAAWWLYAFSDTVWMYTAASLLSGLGYGLGSMIPVAVLIRGWFNSRRSTAVGICSAGSGISMIVFPPIVTQLIETAGIPASFAAQAIFVTLVTLIVFLCVRDLPEELGMEPYGAPGADPAKQARRPCGAGGEGGRGELWLLSAVCLILGGVASTALGHYSAYFHTQGYPMMMISLGISLFGLALTFGKLLCGMAFDRFGGKRTGAVFLLTETLGVCLCCLTDGRGYALLYGGMLLTGVGLSASTIGLPVWAEDFSRPGAYQRTLQRFQILHAVGGMLFSLLPGVIFDHTGSYRGAYILMGLALFLALLFLLSAYRKAAAEAGRPALLPETEEEPQRERPAGGRRPD